MRVNYALILLKLPTTLFDISVRVNTITCGGPGGLTLVCVCLQTVGWTSTKSARLRWPMTVNPTWGTSVKSTAATWPPWWTPTTRPGPWWWTCAYGRSSQEVSWCANQKMTHYSRIVNVINAVAKTHKAPSGLWFKKKSNDYIRHIFMWRYITVFNELCLLNMSTSNLINANVNFRLKWLFMYKKL